MTIDVSVLVLEARLTPAELEPLARKTLTRGGTNVSLLLVDERAGPAALRERLGAYTALSVWGDEEGEGWDAFAQALTDAHGGPSLAFTVAEHASVGCWQLLEPRRPGPAHWLSGKGYRSAPALGLLAAFGVELPEDEAHALPQALTAAERGLCLRSSSAAIPPGELDGALARRIVEDAVRGAEYACCLLGHGE